MNAALMDGSLLYTMFLNAHVLCKRRAGNSLEAKTTSRFMPPLESTASLTALNSSTKLHTAAAACSCKGEAHKW